MKKDGETKELLKEVSDRSRAPIVQGKSVLVPLKFDDDGDILNSDTFDVRKHLKRLSLDDLRFLKSWRENDWNIEKTVSSLAIPEDSAKRLIKKLQVFREEDALTKSLSEIPTPAWISAKHVENVYNGGQLEDSERDSLKELAKISGAYKTQASVNQTINIFQMPKLSPEAAQKLKEFADLQADVVDGEIAA